MNRCQLLLVCLAEKRILREWNTAMGVRIITTGCPNGSVRIAEHASDDGR